MTNANDVSVTKINYVFTLPFYEKCCLAPIKNQKYPPAEEASA
jgi:riboflavin transporter FmnP